MIYSKSDGVENTARPMARDLADAFSRGPVVLRDQRLLSPPGFGVTIPLHLAEEGMPCWGLLTREGSTPGTGTSRGKAR
jgi:hypothetical protein